MPKKKLVILTCIWRRPEITALFLTELKALQKMATPFHLIPVVVGSEMDSSRHLAMRYGFQYVHHANKPLGAKWNAGLHYCMDVEFDYLMVLGSDDLVNLAMLRVIDQQIRAGHQYIGVTDFYALNMRDMRLQYWGGYLNHRKGEAVGSCRVMSRNILETAGWKVWSMKKNKGLDGSMTKRFAKLKIQCHTISCLNSGGRLMAVKSRQAMSSYHKLNGPKVQLSKFFAKHFSKDLLMRISKM